MRLDVRRWLLVALLVSAVSPVQADTTLKEAYTAILSGDYSAGLSAVRTLRERNGGDGELDRISQWLDSFQEVRTSREELRSSTFEWNFNHAQEALANGRTYLALSFAVQASYYAADQDEFTRLPWVRDLREKALAQADSYMKRERWTRAHAYYVQLERIHDKDEEIRALRRRAASHVRLELVYSDGEAVERRIKDVHAGLMEQAFGLINDNYYEEPDFRVMAEGALDQLIALVSTSKLYDASDIFHGIANPAAREHFIGRIRELLRKLPPPEEGTFGYRELIRLYRGVVDANKASVSLPEALLVVEFTEGALNRLDDFTSMVWPADSSEFDKMMIGNFFGVGIQLGVDEDTGRLKVVTPLENSPALEAGIQPDDLIVEVDGESTRGWSTDKAVREITGPEGTPVELTIYRPAAGKRIAFPLKRRQIQLTTVRGVNRVRTDNGYDWNYMLDAEAGVALIRLTGFNPDSQKELLAALESARKQGMKGLILDLRYNPGGLLDVAIDIVSVFLKDGEIVATRGRREPRQAHSALGDPEYADLPLVVLVNEQSASASEILSGALQDHQRAMVLGERTFGKGSVQRVLRLDRRFSFGGKPSARLKLTTALYFLPSGRSPHRQVDAEQWGVDPDWLVAMTPKEMSRYLVAQREAYIIHNESQNGEEQIDADRLAAEKESLRQEKPADEQDEEGLEDDDLLSEDDLKLLRSDPYEAPDIDAQLETALLQLRVKMAANLPWPRQLARARGDANP